MRRAITLIFAGALLASTTIAATAMAAPPEAPDAKALVNGKYAKIQEIIAKTKDDKAVRAQIVEVLGSFTDFDKFGQLTIKKYWGDLSEAQRKLFVERYRLLIHKSYVKHFKANQKLAVSLRGEPVHRKGKTLIKTTVKSGDTEAYVDYKLHSTADGLKAYDIVIDDVSLMRNYRKQFGRILKSDGFDKLIEKINNKIDKPDDEDDDEL